MNRIKLRVFKFQKRINVKISNLAVVKNCKKKIKKIFSEALERSVWWGEWKEMKDWKVGSWKGASEFSILSCEYAECHLRDRIRRWQ